MNAVISVSYHHIRSSETLYISPNDFMTDKLSGATTILIIMVQHCTTGLKKKTEHTKLEI